MGLVLIMFEEYDVVRVTKLLMPSRSFEVSQGFARTPQIGDEGTIVHLAEKNSQIFYIVESVNEEGFTLWLADFAPEELELVWKGGVKEY